MDILTVVSKAISLVLEITGSPTLKGIIASIRDYDKETKMLAETVHFIGDVLSDIEAFQLQEKKSEVNAYNRLRSAYLDAQDFLDVLQTARSKLEAEDRIIKQAQQEILRKANGKGTKRGSLASAQIKIKSITNKVSASPSL